MLLVTSSGHGACSKAIDATVASTDGDADDGKALAVGDGIGEHPSKSETPHAAGMRARFAKPAGVGLGANAGLLPSHFDLYPHAATDTGSCLLRG